MHVHICPLNKGGINIKEPVVVNLVIIFLILACRLRGNRYLGEKILFRSSGILLGIALANKSLRIIFLY